MNKDLEYELELYGLIADSAFTRSGFGKMDLREMQYQYALSIIRRDMSFNQIPTGMGKTVISAIVGNYYQKRSESVLFLYSQLAIQVQSEEVFGDFGIIDGIHHENIYRIGKKPNHFKHIFLVS